MRLGMGLNLGDRLRFASAAAPVSTLVDGLVAYWPLGEESGSRVDTKGDADLTDNNTVGSDTGKNGTAASFVAANSESLSCSAVVTSGSFEAAFWFNPNNGGSTACFAANDISYWYINHGFGGQVVSAYLSDSSSGQVNTGSIALPNGEWHLVTLAYDATTKKGTLRVDNDNASETDALTNGLKYGTLLYLSGSDYPTTGLMDEVAIWSRVLTADERAELYNSGDGVFYNGTTFA